jgi:integrase
MICAALPLTQEVHPRVVMEIFGQSQISQTMNTYSHVMPVANSGAAERLNDLLTTG